MDRIEINQLSRSEKNYLIIKELIRNAKLKNREQAKSIEINIDPKPINHSEFGLRQRKKICIQ